MAVLLTVIGLLLSSARDAGWLRTGDSIESPTDVPVLADIQYDAIGDSITFGDSFSFTVDQSGHPKKTNITFQGWPGLLSHLLTKKTGINTVVLNEGHPGDRAAKARIERLPALLQRNPNSDRALVLLGTNHLGEFNATPSGEGCSGTACDETFKGDMLAIVSSLKDNGRDPIHVALIPPMWGPDDDTLYREPLGNVAKRNRLISEYNRVITNEIVTQPGVKSGPDFFSCFLTPTVNRFSLFKDRIHPNALGYLFMAVLWRDAISEELLVPPVGSCPSSVYILESLDPYVHGHKQNLLEEGDEYYTDESFVLTSIPIELADGIWVTQANADHNNRDESFLNFDAGQNPVSVYIAYDPAGNPPLSLSHTFAPTTLSVDLTVSDPSLGMFSIVKADGVTGLVSIGGNRSASGAAQQQGYVAIVVP